MTRDEATRHSQQLLWNAQNVAQHAWPVGSLERLAFGYRLDVELCQRAARERELVTALRLAMGRCCE